jgi:hypothetical protein
LGILVLLLIITGVIALPAIAYVEILRWWRGAYAVRAPFDEMNHDPPKNPDDSGRLVGAPFDQMNHDPPNPPANPGRWPNITDINV